MPPQLRLTFDQTWSYSSDNFIIHRGVTDAIDCAITKATEGDGSIVFISGQRRTGKTHLAVYVAAMLVALGHGVDVVQGMGVDAWQQNTGNKQGVQSLVIDDAHTWLEGQFGEGLFLAISQRIAETNGVLVVISAKPLWQLQINPIIERCLADSEQTEMAAPSPEELPVLIDTMSLQRGLKFSRAKRDFILKKVETTIAGISDALERIQKTGEHSRASTSFKVLELALR